MLRGGAHLTYCSNIHPGEHWDDVSRTLAEALPRVRQHLGISGTFPIGLRLSAAAAETLAQPDALRAYTAFLRDGNYCVPTINGFPYGAFHATRVKERVYLPDWRSPERVAYTTRLADILATLGVATGLTKTSISTVPGAFRSEVRTDADLRAIARRTIEFVAHSVGLEARTGVRVTLAIEPEPACVFETTAETVAFIAGQLCDPENLAAVSHANDHVLTADDVVKHVGLCLDVCHMAVEFEDPAEAVALARAAGVQIVKVQLSSALRVASSSADARTPRQLLAAFAEDTYLHQVVTRSASGLTRYTDLPEALDRAGDCAAGDDEWRVHFHVPIFLARLDGFETTQGYLANAIDLFRREADVPCFEVETYTWDVLPAEYRTSDVCEAIARELAWARARLDR